MLLLGKGLQAAAVEGRGKQTMPLRRHFLAQLKGSRSQKLPVQVRGWVEQANAFESKGAYGKAAELWVQVLTWNEKALGPDHPATATCLNKLARLYASQGAYAKAEPLYLRALAITEKGVSSSLQYTPYLASDH